MGNHSWGCFIYLKTKVVKIRIFIYRLAESSVATFVVLRGLNGNSSTGMYYVASCNIEIIYTNFFNVSQWKCSHKFVQQNMFINITQHFNKGLKCRSNVFTPHTISTKMLSKLIR